jgi:molybdopterin-guanine dinucleotide biosynthesis protein A
VVNPLVDDIIVAAQTRAEADKYTALLPTDATLVVPDDSANGLLGLALKGLEASQGEHSLLVSSDSPLISINVLDLLFELCPGKTAVIPRWPNQNIEPLHAVYHTASALKAGQMATEESASDLDSLIDLLGGVRYLSTLAIQEFDPELKTFFTVKTPVDLKMAETLSKEKPWKAREKRKSR